jgi:hypothetical protein
MNGSTDIIIRRSGAVPQPAKVCEAGVNISAGAMVEFEHLRAGIDIISIGASRPGF